MSGFRVILSDALSFFRELDANDNRDWFTENKDRYPEVVKRLAEFFVKLMEENLNQTTGETLTALRC